MAETIREASENIYEVKGDAAPPAYFLSLTISNVRCFGLGQRLDLSDGNGHPAQWTVLLGENGVGKTTLLQSIAALQADEDIRIEDTKTIDGNLKNHPSTYLPIGFRSTSNSFRGLFDRVESARRKKRYDTDDELSLYAEVAVGTLIGDHSLIAVEEFGFDGNLAIRSSHGSVYVANLIIFAYGAHRRAGQNVLSPSEFKDTCKTIFDADAELVGAEEWLLQTNYATVVGKNSQKMLAQNRLQKVKKLLIQILPDISDFHFGTSDDSSLTPRVEAKTPYGWVRVADLSLGYKTALTWMVDFASRLFERYPDSENPLAEPAICLVDEIDLHLHPRWQRELVQKLTETFPNTQFIVTAHSPLIVQAAPNANIALLRREGDHVVIENDVDEIRNWRVDQILTSDLFGLETARPPQIAPALEERRRILSKPDVNETDRKRLAELDTIIGELPTGETSADIRSMELMKQAAELLSRGNAKK